MPCYFPLQASYSVRSDGKKDIQFSDAQARLFHAGLQSVGDSNLSIPCGQCVGCRLERSRQWALRCVHESQMYEDNCFVTLTFDDEHLAKMCPGGSLVRKHVQDFLKRLRKKFARGFDYLERTRKGDVSKFFQRDGIRVFYCGEYGEELYRPHYHLSLFNCAFPDREHWKTVNGFHYYNSDVLDSVWTIDGSQIGHAVVADFSFETAAYVARYCTKKITGSQADDHYQGRLPEFCGMSLKPGIGRVWLDKFGKTDVFPFDNCIVRGVQCKPPRYYDKRLEADDVSAFELLKLRRAARGELKAADSTFDRLAVRLKCQEARFKKLIRKMENL